MPLKKRVTPAPFHIRELGEIEYLLISHGHHDHLDLKTIKYAKNQIKQALLPLKMGRLIKRANSHITFQEAGWYQKYDIEDEIIDVYFLPAHHWHSRNFFDYNRVLWGSFLITFEVTETAMVQDIEKGLDFIKNLKKEGFKFAIDDFGVGYSSLKYLKEIPADYIKIDGTFIKNIDKDEKNREFVKNINIIIKSSNKLSIAEFVENEDILKILKNLGIDYAQGYYIGKPSPKI